MIEIEKGVPFMSPLWNESNNELGRALLEMGIGDSFVLPKKLQSRVSKMSHGVGIRVATRTVSATQIRVWRIG